MGESGKTVAFQSDAFKTLGLGYAIVKSIENKASADLMGLEWAAVQGKYYGGESTVKYVTQGSIITCDKGNLFTRIDLPVDHGIETKGAHLSILTVQDFGSQNIPSFGLCFIKQLMSPDQNDKDCTPKVTSQWTQDAITTSTENAALLQADALAVCSTGGLICVKEVNKTPQEGLMCALREQFGFDQRTVKIMMDLYRLIEENYPGKSNREIGWYFARSLSQLGGYNNKPVKFIFEKKIESNAWRRGAGWVYEYDDVSMKEWFKKIGLEDKDYLYLKQMVRLQNLMTSNSDYTYEAAETLSKNYKDNKKSYAEFEKWVKNMGRLGEKYIDDDGIIDIEGYLQRYKEIYDSYEEKGDFPHMLYTISAGLVDKNKENKVQFDKWNGGGSKLGWSSSEERQDIAGWLGDAIYAPDGKTSFKYDDFVSDLDADNIVQRVDDDTSLLEAIDQYYQTPPLNDEERIGEFLENNDYTDVEKIIFDRIKLKDNNNDNEISIQDLDKNKFGDTINFLRSLKSGRYVQ